MTWMKSQLYDKDKPVSLQMSDIWKAVEGSQSSSFLLEMKN